MICLLHKITEENKIIYICIISLLLFRFVHQLIKFIIESKFIDLGYHYFYANMVRLGFNLFDTISIEKAKLLVPIRFAGGEAVYSPSYFVFFQPLTHIPFSLLSILWLIFSVILCFFAITIFLYNSKQNLSWLMVGFICILVFTYQPLYEDLILGQNNCLLLILAVGLWLGFKKDISWLSGISLAFMAFIKIQFGILIIFLFFLNEKKVFFYATIIWIILFLAGLPQLGFEHYRKYFFALFNHTFKVTSDLNNLSLNGLWHRLFHNNMRLATAINCITSLFIFFRVLVWSKRHKEKISMEFPIIAGITMIPLVSPNTEPHHLVVILLPLIFASLYIKHAKLKTKLFFVISTVLIVSRYSFNRFAMSSDSIFTLLLSLKIIGVLMLLFVLIEMGTEIYKNGRLINCDPQNNILEFS